VPGLGESLVIAVFLLLGGLFAAVSFYLVRSGRKTGARLARMTAATTVRVADAPLSGIVELTGVARTIDEATLAVSPVDGTRCIFWRVRVDESRGSTMLKLVEETGAADFHLDDGSGAFARIRTEHATIGRTTRIPDGLDRALADRFLAKHRIDKKFEDLLFFEDRIDPGADVYVLGEASAARDGAGEAGAGPFRSDRRERIVVDVPKEKGGELVVSVGDEAALAGKLDEDTKSSRGLGRGFAVVAFLMFAIAAVIVISWLRGC
jgi:hypothetical protein